MSEDNSITFSPLISLKKSQALHIQNITNGKWNSIRVYGKHLFVSNDLGSIVFFEICVHNEEYCIDKIKPEELGIVKIKKSGELSLGDIDLPITTWNGLFTIHMNQVSFYLFKNELNKFDLI